MHLPKNNEERQKVESYLGRPPLWRILDLLCEFILCVLLLITGLVEGLFGWLNYIPDEIKTRVKNHILRWLQYAESEVKRIKTRVHDFFHKDPTPL